MNRTGLIIALAIAAVVGLLFGLFPQLDLDVAAPFHDISTPADMLSAWHLYPPVMAARDIGLWIGTIVLVAPAVVALIVKLILPRRKMLITGRADRVPDRDDGARRRASWSMSRSRIIGAGRGRST